MNIYETTTSYLTQLFPTQEWSDMQKLIERASASKPHNWQLPFITCEAVGGNVEEAIPAAAAIACLQIGILLIDDLLDEDPRGVHHTIGTAQAANLAATFQAVGLDAISSSAAKPQTKLRVLHHLNEMLLTTAFGQHLDIHNPSNEDDYWQLVRTKSTPFFREAFYIGALLGQATDEVAKNIRQLGDLYGEIIQIHDDINDALAVPANPDWIMGRFPLPLLFAQVVDHPERERFIQLRTNITRPEALEEAQTILIRCGAISYAVAHLIERHKKAQQLLESMPLVNKQKLSGLLDTAIAPVNRLLDTVQ